MAAFSNDNKPKSIFIKRIYTFFKKHWIWCSIFVQIPTIWFSAIIQFMGEKFALTTDTNELTTLGIILTIAIVVLSGVFTFFYNSISSNAEIDIINNKEDLESEKEYLSTIISNINKICEEKYSTLVNVVATEKDSEVLRATIISNPSNQLRRIIEGITECLATLLSTKDNIFASNDFLVSIAYKFPLEDNTWRWTDGMGQKELNFDVLLSKDCKSTFNYLIKSGRSFYFNNKKESAKKDNHYFYTPQDETLADRREIVGSIFCCKYQVKNKNDGKVYVDSMISVTTQRKRFCVDKKSIYRTVCTNMHNLITSEFGNRIGIELSLLYLEYLKEHEFNTSSINEQQPNV